MGVESVARGAEEILPDPVPTEFYVVYLGPQPCNCQQPLDTQYSTDPSP